MCFNECPVKDGVLKPWELSSATTYALVAQRKADEATCRDPPQGHRNELARQFVGEGFWRPQVAHDLAGILFPRRSGDSEQTRTPAHGNRPTR